MEEIHSSSSNFENDYDDYYSQKSPKKVIHQFYFAKFHPSFVDPALKKKVEKSNELIQRMDRAREIISREIRSIEVKVPEKRDEIDRLRRSGFLSVQCIMTFVEGLVRQLEIQWPGENNDIDLHQDFEVVEDIVEDINVDEKIEELSKTLNHGRRNLAEERRLLRELKVMQRRKNKHHDHPVKPTTFQRPRWNSKECIQQRILTALKEARDKRERERKLIEEYEAMKDETQKRVMPLKEKEADIDREKARANRRILKVRTRLNEQVAIYDEYLTIKIKANELAEKKDLVALEELSYKQVEEFMFRWKSDESFRANYKRSIIPSLRDRRLSCDGRRLDEELWRKIP